MFLLGAAITPMRAQEFLPYPPDAPNFLTQWHGDLSSNWDVTGQVELGHAGEELMIDGVAWKHIVGAWRSEFWYGPFDTTYIQITPLLHHSYMRCDSAQVTWVHWTPTDTAEIWFDPALQPGDTVPETWYIARIYDAPIVLSGIEMVADLFGSDRRCYHFAGPPGMTFAEGMGYMEAPMLNYEGVSELMDPFDMHMLICHAEGDSLSFWGLCPSVTAGIAEPAPSIDLRIVQNPVTHELVFAEAPEAGSRFAILDATGRLVQSGKVENGQVDVGQLLPAMYVLRVEGHHRRPVGTVHFMKAWPY